MIDENDVINMANEIRQYCRDNDCTFCGLRANDGIRFCILGWDIPASWPLDEVNSDEGE